MFTRTTFIFICVIFTNICEAQVNLTDSGYIEIGYSHSQYRGYQISGLNVSINKTYKRFELGVLVNGYSKSHILNQYNLSEDNLKLGIIEIALSLGKKLYSYKSFNISTKLLNGLCYSRISDINSNDLKWYGKTPVNSTYTLVNNQNFYLSPSLNIEYKIVKKLSIYNSYQYRFIFGNTKFGNPTDFNVLSSFLGLKFAF